MTQDEQYEFESVAGSLLEELGYPLVTVQQPSQVTTQAPTVWLTGLPSSGKSTIAHLVAERLRTAGESVEVLDGDEVRGQRSPGLGFTRADRTEQGLLLATLAADHAKGGSVAIVAAVSPYRYLRARARQLVGPGFVEVHVRASLQRCEQRDIKGLYARARLGGVNHLTGFSDPYEVPLSPELELNTEQETPQESCGRVLEAMRAARERTALSV